MTNEQEPQISDPLMGLAMEFRLLVIDEVRKVRKNIVVPQLRAGAGHHRSFSIVPGGTKTMTIHKPSTRKRTYEFVVISIMDLFAAPDDKALEKAARGLGGIVPYTRATQVPNRFTGDSNADPFKGRFSLGALYEVATAIRRGGSIPEEVSMEFEAIWKEDQISRIIIHLEYPGDLESRNQPEVFGKPLETIPREMAADIAHTCVEQIRHQAEARYHISPATLESYISLDDTGTKVFGIGIRRWLD